MTQPVIKTCPACGQTYTLAQWHAAGPQRWGTGGYVLEMVVCHGVTESGERCTDGLCITISRPSDEDDVRPFRAQERLTAEAA